MTQPPFPASEQQESRGQAMKLELRSSVFTSHNHVFFRIDPLK